MDSKMLDGKGCASISVRNTFPFQVRGGGFVLFDIFAIGWLDACFSLYSEMPLYK